MEENYKGRYQICNNFRTTTTTFTTATTAIASTGTTKLALSRIHCNNCMPLYEINNAVKQLPEARKYWPPCSKAHIMYNCKASCEVKKAVKSRFGLSADLAIGHMKS